ncbi:hypothetical protein JKP88DRAFT_169329 [Tribonema minus]|uniref:Uncharacterized protein n=1 Tax=Tribonema minus TaxID=303371 RepID=A0A836CAN8_9STRA|nr:hypothetical protein JKP88DRAFT_169329 [Tribonema minus]
MDWTSGPDRYCVSVGDEPSWGWTRVFTMHAFAVSKYHLLERLDPPSYRIVKGTHIKPERDWRCCFAFFAFDGPVPGSTQLFVQMRGEPHIRSRVALTHSERWEDHLSMYVFCMPMPNTAQFNVHYTVRSAESLDAFPEQDRIHLGEPRDRWELKLTFYAYPSPVVLLEEPP